MNVPKLRFKEFNDKWKPINLANTFQYFSTNSFSREQLSESGILKNLHYGDIHRKYNSIVNENKDITSYIKDINYVNKYELLKNNDLIFADASEDYEGIGKAVEVVNVNNNTVSGLHTILARDNSNVFAPMFKGYYFNSPIVHNQVRVLANGFKVYGISRDSINKLNIRIPSIQEQSKIANTLYLLDKKIELQTKKIEDLKLFKLRLFENLTCKIEECIKVKEIGTLKNGYAFKNSQYDDDGLYNILTISNVNGNMYINDIFKNHYSFLPKDIQNHQILKEKDILISMTGNVGRVSYNKGKNNLLNQRVGILEIKENVNKDFIFYMLNNKKFENAMIDCGQGAAQLNISKSDIENFSIPYPNNQSQTKISKILNIISKKIKIENDKLNHYINLKKGLMQNMFV